SGHYIQETDHMDQSLSLGNTFASAAYKLKFTVDNGSGPHAILSGDDLTSFNVHQSEFSELLIFGDVSTKYPSFSRLYLGVLSRSIIAIPALYGILRDTSGCAAVYQARLDSSPGTATSSLFQFAFSLGPVINPIDLLQLSHDIAAQPTLKDCRVFLPSQLDSRIVQQLSTPFKSTCTYGGGVTPHTFSLAVEIRDEPGGTLAVANANMFINQLTTTVLPYLTGSFGLKIDDYYSVPIEANVVLNFSTTSGVEDIGFSIDEAQQTIVLVNRSTLDLQLIQYATYTTSQISVLSLHLVLQSQKITTVPLPGNHSDPSFLVVIDSTLALENPFTKQDLWRYLAFQVEDVQQVQYDLAINASNIDFKKHGISQLTAQISFDDLPNLLVPQLSLTADVLFDRTRIPVPVENAISTLAAAIVFTVNYIDPQHPAVFFTRTNDFLDHVVFFVRDVDIPAT
ncbi:MAG: hypothetical protein ACJ8CB_01265, partial [Ktedonobacteraceae bacterium]